MDPTPSTSPTDAPTSADAPSRVSRWPLVFSLLLIVIGVVYLVISFKRFFQPPPPRPTPMASVDLAEQAMRFVRVDKPAPLSEPMERILEEAKLDHQASQQHPLLGKVAPEFTRPDVDGKPWALKEALKKGPVVVIFYLGYICNHCVAQLFDANEDIARFRELGAEVVALSPDSAEFTRGQYKQYGRFDFPLLSDHGNRIAEAYGVFTRAKGDTKDDLKHGTFVLDQDGVVRWAMIGDAPFSHNATLLYEVAKIQKRID